MSKGEKCTSLIFFGQFGYSMVSRGHVSSISEYRHVSYLRYVGLFPPSLQWVPACTSSPPSSVLWVHTSPLRSLGWSLVALAHPYLLPLRTFGRHIRAHRNLVLCGRVNNPVFSRGNGRFSQVPGESLDTCHGLATPAAPNNLALSVVRMLPSAGLRTSASATKNISELNPHSLHPCCLRFSARRSPDERQDSLPACLLRL